MHVKKIALFPVILLIVGALVFAACNGDDDDDVTPTPTPDETPVNGGDELINRFPEDVRPLLEGLPDNVIEALWNVREAGPGTLVWKDSGGELHEGYRRAYIADWERVTGWNVLNQSPVAAPGDLRAQVDTGAPEWDVLEIGSIGDALLMTQENLLEPLDYDLLQHAIDNFPEDYQWDDNWIQYGFFGVLLIWNQDVYPEGEEPQSALDLFNTEEFPGRRCLFNYPQFAGTLEYPLLADGVSPEQLYPLDLDRAFAKLDSIRGDIVWWGSGAESVQFIVDGTCDMGTTWQGRPALRLKDEPDLPIGWTWTDTLLIDAGLGIPRGAANYDAAMSLLAFGFTPDRQCEFLNELGYGVPMDEACLDDFGRTWAVTDEHMEQTIAHQDPQYYLDNIDSVVDEFNAWLTD